ncbi:MAG: class I SAM-dependent methyltransferase, partial [Deltaproteobacteria bacterium]|nr:class I SAM-dependent methyltransferase [Deltaproteobacteria bacterium]
FRYLAEQAPGRALAWDCATGNGQAALGLRPYFEKVVGTDASGKQVAQVSFDPKIEYWVASAEDSGLAAASVDLVTVAQAVHWFDFERFFAEVRRVLRPRGCLAIWGYHLLHCDPSVDPLLEDFYSRIVGPYWPPERHWVEEKYRTIPFPFEEIQAPEFSMQAEWNLEALLGYLGTWSAVQKFREAKGEDPIVALRRKIEAIWGDPSRVKAIHWPIFLRVGRGP